MNVFLPIFKNPLFYCQTLHMNKLSSSFPSLLFRNSQFSPLKPFPYFLEFIHREIYNIHKINGFQYSMYNVDQFLADNKLTVTIQDAQNDNNFCLMKNMSQWSLYLLFISHGSSPQDSHFCHGFFLKSLHGISLWSQKFSNKIELKITFIILRTKLLHDLTPWGLTLSQLAIFMLNSLLLDSEQVLYYWFQLLHSNKQLKEHFIKLLCLLILRE